MKGPSEITSCASAQEWLLRDVDGELTPEESARLREHQSHCARCAMEAARLAQIGTLLRRDPLALTQVRLPSAEALARSVVEAENSRPRRATPALARWAAGAVAALGVTFLLTHSPALRPGRQGNVAPVRSAAPAGFWIEDDEQTGRTVLMDSRLARPEVR